MSALCQDSLARQQNINCFQLAEFPSFSCSCGQSEASLVERSTFTVATAPLHLIYTPHTVLCFREMAKITRKSETGRSCRSGWRKSSPNKGGLSVLYILYHAFFGRPFPPTNQRLRVSIWHYRSWGYLRGWGWWLQMSKTWDILKAEARARQRPLPIADACGVSSDIWATARMWEHSSRQVWVVLRVSMQLGQKTNRTYLSNPSLTATDTHLYTGTNTHRDTKHADPQWGDLFATELHVFIPLLLWNDSVSIGDFERLKPCLEDNLGRTIWSRFPSLFSVFFSFSIERMKKTTFCSLEMHMNMIYLYKWIIEQHLSQKWQLVQHPKPVVNYIIYTYTITDHFQLLLPIWMLQQSHCPPSLIAVDTGNLI